MVTNEELKAFVRNTMGCGCPDEVFLHMECRSDTKIEGVPLRARIDVGNRLLIYVYKWDLSGSLQEILPRLVDMGTRERDELGFNRFRLAIAVESPGDLEDAEMLFKSVAKDDQVYLHIIPEKIFPRF